MLSLGTVSIRLPQIGSPSGRFFSTAGMQDPLLRPGSELRAVGGGSVGGLFCLEVEYFGQLPETLHFCHVFSGCRCLDLCNIVLVLTHVIYIHAFIIIHISLIIISKSIRFIMTDKVRRPWTEEIRVSKSESTARVRELCQVLRICDM